MTRDKRTIKIDPGSMTAVNNVVVFEPHWTKEQQQSYASQTLEKASNFTDRIVFQPNYLDFQLPKTDDNMVCFGPVMKNLYLVRTVLDYLSGIKQCFVHMNTLKAYSYVTINFVETASTRFNVANYYHSHHMTVNDASCYITALAEFVEKVQKLNKSVIASQSPTTRSPTTSSTSRPLAGNRTPGARVLLDGGDA